MGNLVKLANPGRQSWCLCSREGEDRTGAYEKSGAKSLKFSESIDFGGCQAKS